METQVKIGNTTITISEDKKGNVTVVSDGHFSLIMQEMGLPGISGPELFFDTKQLVEELNEEMKKEAYASI